MHTHNEGGQRHAENIHHHPLIARNGRNRRPSGLLSRDHLQRLVAAMVD